MTENEPSKTHATLIADGHTLSTGRADVSPIDHCGLFWPNNFETLSTIPDRPITLRLHEGKDRDIAITKLAPCDKPLLTMHWHFDLVERS